MALFKNTNISFETKNGDTVIGNEAYFQGTLTAKGSMRIDGRVDGSIVDAKIVTSAIQQGRAIFPVRSGMSAAR